VDNLEKTLIDKANTIKDFAKKSLLSEDTQELFYYFDDYFILEIRREVNLEQWKKIKNAKR
jgi:hypothetical protein